MEQRGRNGLRRCFGGIPFLLRVCLTCCTPDSSVRQRANDYYRHGNCALGGYYRGYFYPPHLRLDGPPRHRGPFRLDLCAGRLFREKGTIYMLSVLAIVWVADIMAYFGGRCFGGPKMAQGISPKKTWSGALTAFVCVLALSYVLYWAQPSFPLWTNALISHLTGWTSALILILVVLFSIAGDLFESALKRTAGVKDSSNLLPGHGGFYDRLDAQMSVLPLTVFILLFLQGY